MDCLLWETLDTGAGAANTILSSCCRTALVALCRSNPHEEVRSNMPLVSSLIGAWSVGLIMSLVFALRNGAFAGVWTAFFLAFLHPFVSGVTLATGLLYLLPFAFRALDGSCSHPSMRRFPVAGVTATAAVLFTLMVDLWGSVGNIRRKLEARQQREKGVSSFGQMGDDVERGESVTSELAKQGVEDGSKDFVDSTHGGSNSTSINRTDEDLNNGPKGQINDSVTSDAKQGVDDGSKDTVDSTHGSSNITFNRTDQDLNNGSKAQINDSGDASVTQELFDSEFHQVARQIWWAASPSVIVALTLGVSRTPCTSWPLFVVLYFRQIFQAVKWISLAPHIQAMNSWKTKIFCLMISMMLIPLITTLGSILSSTFIKSDARALILEGFFNAATGGVLVYQACANLLGTYYTILEKNYDSSNKSFIQLSLYHVAGLLGIGIMILAKVVSE